LNLYVIQEIEGGEPLPPVPFTEREMWTLAWNGIVPSHWRADRRRKACDAMVLKDDERTYYRWFLTV
jgi:hypothetical protein